MIHRKWSLLTGPPTILAGIVATVVVANFIFSKDHPSAKSEQKNSQLPPTK